MGEIDAVRGLALGGILPVNFVGLAGLSAGHDLYETLLHQRLFPIFSLLFGLSAALFLRTADRTVLLARFGFLIPFGVLHQALQPREVLLPYAIAGIVVLLPASFLPRAAVLAAGLIATAAALALADGGAWLIPGLFLLGMAAGRYGVPDLIERRSLWIPITFGVTAPLAITLNAGQALANNAPLSATAGLATGAAYTTGLLLLLRSPDTPGPGRTTADQPGQRSAPRPRAHPPGLLLSRAQGPLRFVLEPLGRLALTNYVTATPLILAADHLLAATPPAIAAACLGILTIQTAFSRLWLRHFRYGPLEWIWRCLTWWRIVPNRAR